MVGTKLAHYEITGHLGTGGMGEVYQATDMKLGRSVAIKLLPEAFIHDAERAARFEREARVLASLNHLNIATIHGIEQSGGRTFLVMELVPGETLAERIKRGPIPLDEALSIATKIVEGLEAAHEKGIIHRDLKPANVKVRDDGAVKVLDFGLAKMETASTTADDDSPTLSALTQPGVIFGTAAYMSPEQACGRPIDSRADIWAFGVMLYEMVTARRPFKGEDLSETLASVVKEAPDMNAVPRKLRRLLVACLQKNPKRRLRAIGDWQLLLTESEPQRISWLWPAIAWVMALAVAVLAWKHFGETPAQVQSLRYQLTRPGDSEFLQFQLSPDGRSLAFAARSGESLRLYVRALDSLEDREFPGTDGITYPFWSPDSTHIAFFSQGKLKQVAAGGGPATIIADAPDGRGGSWGPDGTIVFAPTLVGTLFRVSVSRDGSGGGAATPLDLPRTGPGTRDSLRFPAFLADADRFLYTIESDRNEVDGIYVGSLKGGPPVRILPDFSATRFVRSSGSATRGFILFRRGTTLMAQPFNAANLMMTGEAFPLADQVPDSGNTSSTAFSVSSNGTLIYMSDDSASQDRELVWLDRTGKRGKSILRRKSITDFALSPDGTQLLYSTGGQRIRGDLWLHDVAGGTSQRFTFGPFSAFAPLWSSDGSSVVFTVYPEDRLYKQAARGFSKEESLPVIGTNLYASSWSPDGKFIAFSQTGADSKNDISLLPLDGERIPKAVLHTPFWEGNGQISPDGFFMAYSSDSSLQQEVYVASMTPGGFQRQVSIGGGRYPRWRSDGSELYFISDFRLMAIDVKRGPELTFGTPHELFREPSFFTAEVSGITYQPSADGGQFLALLPVGGAPATHVTVVTNWQAAYGR
ncbi:MAG TPA: protein kinase [Terriglobia bacterium]|jgi:serine/threonine protein kinase